MHKFMDVFKIFCEENGSLGGGGKAKSNNNNKKKFKSQKNKKTVAKSRSKP